MNNLPIHLGSAALDSVAPTQFQSVPFLDKTIDCFLLNNEVYVVLNSLIEAVGLHPVSARQTIKNDEILSQGVASWLPPSPKYQGQKTSCMPLEDVPIWLLLVKMNKAKPEVKETILAFRRDVKKVLFRHYFGEATQVTTGMKRSMEIDTQIRANNAEIKRLTALNEGIKFLKEANAKLKQEKRSINSKITGQLGLNFELLGKEDENDGN